MNLPDNTADILISLGYRPWDDFLVNKIDDEVVGLSWMHQDPMPTAEQIASLSASVATQNALDRIQLEVYREQDRRINEVAPNAIQAHTQGLMIAFTAVTKAILGSTDALDSLEPAIPLMEKGQSVVAIRTAAAVILADPDLLTTWGGKEDPRWP
jgi:hypothetical protein